MTEEVKVNVLTSKKSDDFKEELTTSVQPKRSSLKKTKKQGNGPNLKRRIILLLVKITFFVVLVYVAFFVVFGVTRMNDYNMYPAVKDGDLLFYYRLENKYANGDVVIIKKDNEESVVRIIASAGQELDISEEAELLIDGQPSTFQAFYETPRAETYGFRYPYKVSKDCYFVMNDYRSNTNDSRTFGEVCKNQIRGRLITKIQVRDL